NTAALGCASSACIRRSAALGRTRSNRTRRPAPTPASARVRRNTRIESSCAPTAHSDRKEFRSPLCGVAVSRSTYGAREASAAQPEIAAVDECRSYPEAARQVRNPLFAQAGRRQNQRAVARSARSELRQHQRRLNRFSKADIVGDEHTRTEAADDRQRRLEL